MEAAFGNFLTLKAGDDVRHRFQNFFIGETVTYSSNNFPFLPFGFSGITLNRSGDGTEASLVLPVNDISKSWSIDAMEFYDENGRRKAPWIAHVQVLLLDPDDKTSFAATNPLYQYYGQIAGGSWDEVSLNLTLSTVIDAIGSDVPMRRLTQSLVGSLPTTSGVSLR
tara:strand:+ start:96 stop:596 length:501 start_codon:yes stop_codon:yes gene_type:complete